MPRIALTVLATGFATVLALTACSTSTSGTGGGSGSAPASPSGSSGFPSTSASSSPSSSSTSPSAPTSSASSSTLTKAALLAADQVGSGYVLVNAAVKTLKPSAKPKRSLQFLGCLDATGVQAPGASPATSQAAIGEYTNRSTGGAYLESIEEAASAAQAKALITRSLTFLRKCSTPVIKIGKVTYTRTRNVTTVASAGCDAGVATTTTASARASNGKLLLVSVQSNIVSRGKWAAYFVGYGPLLGADPILASMRPAAMCARLPS